MTYSQHPKGWGILKKMEINRRQRAEEILLCYKEQYKKYWKKQEHFILCLGLNFLLSEILRKEGLDPETGFKLNSEVRNSSQP